jgi:2-oxoglutarate dehydrogenase E2 component (dihydrolipoamide succinyltransferase)
MATEIKLPDMGEGIVDVTISRWRVPVGGTVKAGDVIVEIATDKVDSEVVAPADGTVLAHNFSEGSLAPVDAVIGVIGAAGESADSAQPATAGVNLVAPSDHDQSKANVPPPVAPPQTQVEAATANNAARSGAQAGSGQAAGGTPTGTTGGAAGYATSGTPEDVAGGASGGGEDVKASPVARRVAADKGVSLAAVEGTGPGGQITKSDVLAFADRPQGGTGAAGPALAPSPLPGDLADEASLVVRRTAADHNINLAEIAGGRPYSTLTKYDVLSAVASRAEGKDVKIEPAFPAPTTGSAAAAAAPQPAAGKAAAPAAQAPTAQASTAQAPTAQASTAQAAPPRPAAPAPASAGTLKPGEEMVKHTRMRAAIGKNTSLSAFTAPHVTTMWDIDVSAVLAHRAGHKKEFAAAGVNLTLTAYFVEAIIAGLRKVPAANASYTDEGVIIKRYYNIGMATALPMDQYGLGGLIVPVIKNAGDLNLLGLARAVNELAERARRNELRQDDLADGTFTLSNYGTGGSRFQTPVIVQPQVGILGVGAVEKRAVIVSNGHPLEPNMGDALVIKPMTTLGFSYDHRVLDGATADAFCAAVKTHLESYK